MLEDNTLLHDVPLFSLFDADDLIALLPTLESKSARQGEIVFQMGDPGDRLFVVRTGKVEIFVKDHTGEKIILTVAEPGDPFGELALFDNGPRSATALALEDSDFLVLDREALELFVRSKPDASLHLMAVMAKRIRQTDELLRGRAAKNPNVEIEEELSKVQRLANFIAEYSGSMSFLGINAGLFAVWIVINLNIIPGLTAFDPYPFGLLTMAVSLEAIFLSIFVLLAQNLQAAKDRIRGDVEYEVNLRAELEVAELHEKVDALAARMLERLHRLEKGASSSPRP